MAGVGQLAALLGAFERAALPVIPLKGPALAEDLYGDPALRPFTDLDLLVRPADVPGAVALLGALGYRALEHERPLAYELTHATAACFVPAARGAGLPVDLHWGLVSFPAGATPGTIGTGEVWGRAVAAARWGRRVLGLAREDLLLYLALHLAVHHPFDGRQWQRDIALLVRHDGSALAWDAVAERARRWRVAGAVYYALRLVEDRFAAGVPPAVLAGLRPRAPRGTLLERLARRPERAGRLDHLVTLLLPDGPADLVRALAAAGLPSPAWVRSRYATASAPRGYRAHYRRLGRVALNLVR